MSIEDAISFAKLGRLDPEILIWGFPPKVSTSWLDLINLTSYECLTEWMAHAQTSLVSLELMS